MSNGGWTLIARFSNADSANWRTVVTGGMTEEHFVAVLPIHLTIIACVLALSSYYIKVSRSDDSFNT